MSDRPNRPHRDTKPTLIGLPAFLPHDELPFPLTAYADVHTYTPSSVRETTRPLERTVILPPPPRMPTQVLPYRSPVPTQDPGMTMKMVALGLVLYAMAIGVAITFICS